MRRIIERKSGEENELILPTKSDDNLDRGMKKEVEDFLLNFYIRRITKRFVKNTQKYKN